MLGSLFRWLHASSSTKQMQHRMKSSDGDVRSQAVEGSLAEMRDLLSKVAHQSRKASHLVMVDVALLALPVAIDVESFVWVVELGRESAMQTLSASMLLAGPVLEGRDFLGPKYPRRELVA